MMKILDYDKVNGTQDRDDTILVAKIIPHDSNASQPREGPNGAIVRPDGEHFEAKDLIVAPVSGSPGALNTEERPKVRGNVMV